jgi:hypothetical protein
LDDPPVFRLARVAGIKALDDERGKSRRWFNRFQFCASDSYQQVREQATPGQLDPFTVEQWPRRQPADPGKAGPRWGTSHSRRSNFRAPDLPTAFRCGGSPKLSVPGISQIWAVMNHETLFPSRCKAILEETLANPRVPSTAIWKTGQSAPMMRLCEKSAALQYIDSAHREEVDIRRRSLHINKERELLFAKARLKTRRISYPNRRDDINQRHVAPTCASRVRTTYAHRKGLFACRSQALGRQ